MIFGLVNIIITYVLMVTFNRFILDKTLSRYIKSQQQHRKPIHKSSASSGYYIDTCSRPQSLFNSSCTCIYTSSSFIIFKASPTESMVHSSLRGCGPGSICDSLLLGHSSPFPQHPPHRNGNQYTHHNHPQEIPRPPSMSRAHVRSAWDMQLHQRV